jgi:hypothetical protein
MTTNPFQPPQTTVGDPPGTDVAAPPPRFQVLFVAILFAIHVAVFGNYLGIYYELVCTGVVHPLGPLVGLFSDGIMLVGVLLMVFKRCAQLPFWVAGSGLLLSSMLMWRLPVGREMVLLTYVFGAFVAFCGGRVAYRHARRGG